MRLVSRTGAYKQTVTVEQLVTLAQQMTVSANPGVTKQVSNLSQLNVGVRNDLKYRSSVVGYVHSSLVHHTDSFSDLHFQS